MKKTQNIKLFFYISICDLLCYVTNILYIRLLFYYVLDNYL